MEILNLVLVAVLIALTAFFVATEFALVKVRGTKIDQLVAEGRKGAVSAKHVTTHLDEYLSACQLGITITALGLGWLGEPTVESMLHPLFEKYDVDTFCLSGSFLCHCLRLHHFPACCSWGTCSEDSCNPKSRSIDIAFC